MEYTSIHLLYLFFQNFFDSFLINNVYGIGILYINIYIYIFTLYLLFNILFLFDLSKIKTINNVKIFYKNVFLSVSVVLIFLSMSGVPPLSGFVGKFLLFNYLFFSQKFLFILFFSILNFFSIYFYIQNIRFLISKHYINVFLKKNFYTYFNKKLINTIVFFNFLNFSIILYLNDFLYFFLNIVFFKNIY